MESNTTDRQPTPEKTTTAPTVSDKSLNVVNEDGTPDSSIPEKDSKKVSAENISSEDFGKKYENAGIWTQLLQFTKNIEIEEDDDFCWPEDRTETVSIIKQLLSKRLLFIRSVSDSWMYSSVQRLASVLQAEGVLEKLLIRITRSNFSVDKPGKEKLDFGFWINQQRLPFPTVVFISSDRHDFLEKFLSLSSESLRNELLTGLKKANLYLVCQVDESKIEKSLLNRFQKKAENSFVVWNVPCFKLQVFKKVGKAGEDFMLQVAAKRILQKADERSLYEILFRLDLNNTGDILSPLQYLEDFDSDIDEKKELLVRMLQGDNFLHQIVIFCAAFFDGLYYPDFFKLISELVANKQKHINAGTISKSTLTEGINNQSNSIQPATLIEQWENGATQILMLCLVETRLENGNQRVSFVIPKLAEIISDYITKRQYSFFYHVYTYFEEQKFLIDPDLSERLEPFVIRFFAIAARMDAATLNASWLKNIVQEWWNSYESNIPDNLNFEQITVFLWREKKYESIIFRRIPLIIGGLLTNSNDYFKEIIKEFFRLLLDSTDTKKMAVIIAAYLYKAYRYTDAFSHEDLVSYFRRTLEEGKWEESFFAYDAMEESMGYNEFKKQTKKWIDDDSISNTSWTKKFAYLYQIDFTLITVYRYFRQFNSDAPYELWEPKDNNYFPSSFIELIRDLLSNQSIEGLNSIYPSDEKRLLRTIKYFEAVESKKNLLIQDRFSSKNLEPLTLIADILETWFYILTHKTIKLMDDPFIDDTWTEYAQLIITYCDRSHFFQIRKFWSEKIKIYNSAITNITADNQVARKKNEDYIHQLRMRKNCLKKLITVIQLKLNPLQ